MKVLLDTHAFLWWVSDDPRVSRRARRIIADSSNQILLSAASAWEIAIKTALGRLMIASDPEEFVPEQMRMNGFEPLPIELRHALHVGVLPPHHSDPFDRMLIAQAAIEECTILSADLEIRRCGIRVAR